MKLYSLLETNANIPFLTSALRSTVHDRVDHLNLCAHGSPSSAAGTDFSELVSLTLFEHYSVPRTAFWNWPEILSRRDCSLLIWEPWEGSCLSVAVTVKLI